MKIGSAAVELEISRQWAPGPRGLLELWQHEGARTDRAFGFFSNDDLAWCPLAPERSIGELLVHIAHARAVTTYWLLAPMGTPPRSHSLESGVQPRAARSLLAIAGQELFRTLCDMPAERFDDPVVPFGERETRGVMALGMLKHELHHRGELHAYARVLGKRPVSLYAPILN